MTGEDEPQTQDCKTQDTRHKTKKLALADTNSRVEQSSEASPQTQDCKTQDTRLENLT
jgi:ubiquitin